MDVVILLIFISLALVAAGLVFFAFRLRAGDFDHGDRLALAPLENDGAISATAVADSHKDNGSSEDSEGGTLNVGS